MRNFLVFLHSVRFCCKFFGFKGAINLALGLMRHRTIYIFVVDLKKNKYRLESIINPKLDVRLITNATDFDLIIDDYAAVKGKFLAFRDREHIVSGREYLGVVYLQGRFAGWGWVKKGPIRYGNCQLTQSDCAITKCRTLRSYRRQGVYVTLMAKLQQMLAEKGFQKAYGSAIPYNKASFGGIKKVGFVFLDECDRGSFISRLLRHILGKPRRVEV